MHKQLEVEVTSTGRAARAAHWALTRHALATFGLYVAGFVAFVLRLRKGCYLYQFRQVRGWEGGGRGVGWGFRGVFWRARPRPQPPSSPLRLSQYAWTHLTLLFIFVPTSFFVSNIFDGIIW